MKKKIFLFFLYIFPVILLLFFANCRGNINEYAENQEKIERLSSIEPGEIKVTDSYDSEESTFGDFYRREDALGIEEQAYSKLKENNNIKYYECSFNSLYYIGKYSKKDSAKHEFKNEKLEDGVYTDNYGMCMDQNFYRDYAIYNFVKKGIGFQNDDFEIDVDKTIPVILGTSFRNAFEIGETFAGEYVWQKLQCRVIGFLEENANIMLDGQKVSLNDYMIIPSLSIAKIKNEIHKTVMLSTKMEGYIHYKNIEEYETAAFFVNKVAKESGFRYTHVATRSDYDTISKSQYIKYKISMYSSLVLIFVNLVAIYQIRKKISSK